jgi:hypothetical protein
MTTADRTADGSPCPGAEQAAADRALARIIRVRAGRQRQYQPRGNDAWSDQSHHFISSQRGFRDTRQFAGGAESPSCPSLTQPSYERFRSDVLTAALGPLPTGERGQNGEAFGKIPDPAGSVAATGAPYLPPRYCRQLHKALFANLPKVLIAWIHKEPITSRMGGPKLGRHAKGRSVRLLRLDPVRKVAKILSHRRKPVPMPTIDPDLLREDENGTPRLARERCMPKLF